MSLSDESEEWPECDDQTGNGWKEPDNAKWYAGSVLQHADLATIEGYPVCPCFSREDSEPCDLVVEGPINGPGNMSRYRREPWNAGWTGWWNLRYPHLSPV